METLEQPKTIFSSALDQSNKTITEISDLKNKKITGTKRNVAFASMLVVALATIGLIGAQIISGALALAISVLVGGSLFYGYRFLKQADPLIRQKTKNLMIKKMTEEAKKNKIETLDNLVLSSGARLSSSAESLAKMGGYVRKLSSKIDPQGNNAESKLAMLDEIKEIHDQMISNYRNGYAAHEALKEKVKDYKDMHDFSEIAAEATAFALGNEQDLNEMLGLAAFEQIETDFNEAMSSVEVMTMKYKLEESVNE